jgi:hypothetical protein
MKNNLIFVAILSVLLFACQKEIKYKGSGSKSLLVLNAVVENDSIFSVYLEKSVFFLSAEQNSSKHITSGATITVKNITTGEEFVVSNPTVENRYDFPFVVSPNTSYSIQVEHADYPTISATMISASVIPLLSVDTISVIKNNQSILKSTLTWNDPLDENYYMIRVNMDVEDVEYSYSQLLYISSTDVAIDNSENTDISGNVYDVHELLFDDKKFNGKQKKLEINSNFATYYFSPDVNIKLTYYLISMNKETYLYYRSALKNLYMDEFSEPVKVYSNIKNGFGIFGTVNYSYFIIQ